MRCDHDLGSLSTPRTCDCGLEVHRINQAWYPLPGLQDGRLVEITHNGILPLFENTNHVIRTRYHVIHSMASEFMKSVPPSNTGNKLDERTYEKLGSILAGFGCSMNRLDDKSAMTYDLAVLIYLGSNIPKLPNFGVSTPTPIMTVSNNENLVSIATSRILENSPHKTLKPEQQECIHSVLDTSGSATIAALPTGFGKTLISQASTLGLREKGPTLVISPLISLIDDQEENYRKLNNRIRKNGGEELRIEFLRSTEPYDLDDINYKLLCGSIDVLCCSPETLVTKAGTGLMESIRRLGPNSKGKPFSLFVIDEAHIVSDWGVTIRPQFIMLKNIIRQLIRLNPELRLLFLSATISTKEEHFIKQHLIPKELDRVNIVRITEIRKDIAFNLREFPTEEEIGTAVIQAAQWDINSPFHSIEKAPFLIYTRSPSDAEQFKKYLDRFGKIATYTGETPSRKRGKLRDDFVSNKLDGVVGTSAFGMGIDKSDLQCITYIGRPYSVKDLYQAFGRVSRNSNWSGTTAGKRVCGNAIGILSELSRASPFRPELGVEKMMERLWDLLSDAKIIGEGLIAVNTKPIPAYWEPHNLYPLEEFVVDEDKDDPDIDEGLPYHVIERLREQKRNERSVHFQNWVLSVFSLCEFWDLEGAWRSTCLGLDESTDDEPPKSVEEIWEKNMLTPNRDYILSGDTYTLLSLNHDFFNFETLRNACADVLSQLKSMHTEGARGIQTFVSSDICIRKRFGPSIGLSDNDNLSCDELNATAIHTGDLLVVPCGICRAGYEFNSGDVDPLLWVEYPILEEACKSRFVKEEKIGFDSEWKKLPMGAIDVCKWTKSEKGIFTLLLNKHTNPGLSYLYLHKRPVTDITTEFYDVDGGTKDAQILSVGGSISYVVDRLILHCHHDSDTLTTIIWNDESKLVIRELPENLHRLENTRLKIKHSDPELSDMIQNTMPAGNH